ncbi:hypothetical protein SRHO_G00212960 [Serrasalmus rhombeus]
MLVSFGFDCVFDAGVSLPEARKPDSSSRGAWTRRRWRAVFSRGGREGRTGGGAKTFTQADCQSVKFRFDAYEGHETCLSWSYSETEMPKRRTHTGDVD